MVHRSVNARPARIKVDEPNCFGTIEWNAVKKTAFSPSTQQLQSGNIARFPS